MIRTLIIEDEAPAAERIERMLMDIDPGINILAKLDSVVSSVSWFRSNPHPDLMILDIQLSDGLSFDIFREVQVESFVIFTTAYDEYAIKAFELNSINYLLKPVSREDLESSIDKFKMLTGKGSIDIDAIQSAIEQARKKYKQRFIINAGSRIKSIETKDIAYFYYLNKSSFLCTKEDRHYPVDFSLDRLEELLDPDQFFRINRQHIIQYSSIENINILSRSRIEIITRPRAEESMMVSTAKSHQFREWLDR